LVNGGSVGNRGVVSDQCVERTALSAPVHDEWLQRGRDVYRRARGHAEEGMRHVEAARRDKRGDGGVKGADLYAIVGAIERDPPRPGPHDAAVKAIAAVVHDRERHELLAGSAIGSELEVLVRLEVARDQPEGVVPLVFRRVAL